MTDQVTTSRSNRRELLKLSALGALGAALAPQQAQGAEAAPRISYASWIHGHSLRVEFPDDLVVQRPLGFHMLVEGKPGTVNWFHFAIPTPVIVNDVRLRADTVILSFETGSADALVRDVHIYDGSGKIAEFNGVNLTRENWYHRFEIKTRPEVWQGLGVSIGVTFGTEPMNHWMRFVSAGCDFTLQPPPPPAPENPAW